MLFYFPAEVIENFIYAILETARIELEQFISKTTFSY